MHPVALVHSSRLRPSQLEALRVAQNCVGIAHGGQLAPIWQASSQTAPVSSWQAGFAVQLSTGVDSHVCDGLFTQTWVDVQPPPPPQPEAGAPLPVCPDPPEPTAHAVTVCTSHCGMLAHDPIGTIAQLVG